MSDMAHVICSAYCTINSDRTPIIFIVDNDCDSITSDLLTRKLIKLCKDPLQDETSFLNYIKYLLEAHHVSLPPWYNRQPIDSLNLTIYNFGKCVYINIAEPENFLQNIDKILAARAPTLPDTDALLKFLRGETVVWD